MKKKALWKEFLLILLGIVFILLVPFLINKLVASSTPKWLMPVAGKDELQGVWISFWASYLGSVLSALAAFVILYLTIKHNSEENEANRNNSEKQNADNLAFQQGLSRFGLGKQSINDLRDICANCYMSISGPKAGRVYRVLAMDEITSDELIPQKDIEENLNRSFFMLKAFFPDPREQDEQERESIKAIDSFTRELFACSVDMYFFLSLFLQSPFFLSDLDKVDDAINKYAEKQLKKRVFSPYDGYKYMWEIIRDNSWNDVVLYRKQIVAACCQNKEELDGLLSHEFLKLLAYEEWKNKQNLK